MVVFYRFRPYSYHDTAINDEIYCRLWILGACVGVRGFDSALLSLSISRVIYVRYLRSLSRIYINIDAREHDAVHSAYSYAFLHAAARTRTRARIFSFSYACARDRET